MYRLGEIEHSHRKFYSVLGGFIVLIAVALLLAWHFIKPTPQISAPPAVATTHVSYDTTKLKTFDEPLFRIALPDDWKPIVRNTDIPQPVFSWQGTVKDNKSRWLSVYIDEDVSTLAVNRELSVQATDTSINVLGDASDNCTTFTGSAVQSHGNTPAKWQGIDFLCDSGNYERDVVGIASSDGLNTLKMTGSSGTHKFFFTYTDNSVSPDYSIFINALKSLHLK